MIKLAIANVNDMNAAMQTEIPCQWLEPSKTFKHDKRKKEYQLARYLLYKLIPDNTYPTIHTDENGRPFFINSSMQFNISHSQDMVACIIADSTIGLDIQYTKIKKNFVEIAERFFTESEVQWLKQQDNIADSFNQLWVIKEAILKAEGGGISSGLQKLNIKLQDDLIVENQLSLAGQIALTAYQHANIAICQLNETAVNINSFILQNNELKSLELQWSKGLLTPSFLA